MMSQVVIDVPFGELRNRFNEIRIIVSDISGYELNRIYPSTTINNDIGVDGQDAWDILDAVGERFDMTDRGFELTHYFSDSEPPWPTLYPLVSLILLPLRLIYLCGFLAFRPFGESTWNRVRPFFAAFQPRLLPVRANFTMAQLVAWSYTTHFVLRRDVLFRSSNIH